VRVLTFTTLYPNTIAPRHGIFVETRLRQLLKSGRVRATVVAPVPWFPFKHSAFGQYSQYSKVPRTEMHQGIGVLHPRYPSLPKIGMSLAPLLLAAASKPILRKLISSGADFDLIDAHYFYPDGVAAVMLGEYFDKPVVITARGTDINLIARYWLPRKWILWAAARAHGLVAVSAALAGRLARIGVDERKICILRNGVDVDFFAPIERERERTRLGVEGLLLLSVGNLVELKGHHLAIEALRAFPDAHLLIVGDGPEARNLKSLAQNRGVQRRVMFLGLLPQTELRIYYGIADVLILASSREGLANVLLEAMACGTPVVATRVGGNSEVIASPEAGVLMEERSVEALVGAVRKLLAAFPNRTATRSYALRFGWNDVTSGQLALFEKILRC
jgi:teichuronic acid biosynthesis glycosyltransferase TuaC